MNMNPATDSLKKLQVQFLTSAARWTNYGTEVEPTTVDLPNIVCLLQSVGYNLRRVDLISPDEISSLRDGQKGTTVVITCGYSGQRCILELPEDAEQCKCLVKPDKSQDSFWEVTATNSNSKNSSLIETGSDAVPAISKDLGVLIRNMLILLTHMIQGNLEEMEEILSRSTSSLHSTTSRGATSSPKKDARRLSGFIKDLVNPPIIISSPKGKDSPARYRSLDTLTRNSDDILPTPGALTPKSQLKTNIDISQSSPVILYKNEFTNSSGSTIADSNTEKAIDLMIQAILLLKRNNSQNVSPSTPNKQMTFITGQPLTLNSHIPSAYNHTLATKKNTCPAKSTNLTNSATNIARPTSNGRTAPKSSSLRPTIKPKTSAVKSAESKLIEERSKKIIPRPRKSVNLYPLVKSTIPKASPAGSFVSKKV